jgi:hemolysin activation/secretion protein
MRRAAIWACSASLAPVLWCAGYAQAQGVVRGNPIDSLPAMQPPQNQQPTPQVQAPTPEERILQQRMALTLVPRHFDVTGVTALPFDEVAGVLAPLANQQITLGQLVAQADKITALYRSRGYPLSFAVVQNQTFAEGKVVVTVVEGHIGSVRVEGDIGNAESRLRSLAEPLIAEKPLTQPTLERQLNLMRQVPGVTLTPALELPRRVDGASELVLTASRRAYTVTGGVSDLGTGKQPLVNLGTNSLTPLGEQVKLTSSVPLNTDDVKFLSGEVTIPLANNGLALKIDGYRYRAEPKDEALDELGFKRRQKNDHIGIGVSYPLLLNNRQSLTAAAGLYAANSVDRYDVKDSDRWLQQKTDVRAFNTELHYVQVGETQSTDVTFGIAKGADMLGAKKSIDSNYGYSAKPEDDLDFLRTNLSVRQAFKLPAQFGLVLSGAGQYSDNVLPSSEQVSFGTWRYALGYPQGEQSGDKGVGASIEVNRNFATGLPLVTSILPYLMFDYARAWYN